MGLSWAALLLVAALQPAAVLGAGWWGRRLVEDGGANSTTTADGFEHKDPPFVEEFVQDLYLSHIPTLIPKLVKPPLWLEAFLPPPEKRTYHGLENDLHALIKDRQTKDGWIMMVDYTLGQRDFFLNVSTPDLIPPCMCDGSPCNIPCQMCHCTIRESEQAGLKLVLHPQVWGTGDALLRRSGLPCCLPRLHGHEAAMLQFV